MKTITLLLAFVVTSNFQSVQAQFYYTIADSAVIITGYTGPRGDVVIPDTIEGLPVTAIGSRAFDYITTLTSIDIPDGVTSIGSSAFSGCTSLASVTIGNSVTSIGYSAFEDCTSLASIIIPDSVTSIEGSAFSGCTSLASVTIGNSVTSIGSFAFEGCTSLTAIEVDPLNPSYASLDGVLFNTDQTTLIRYPEGKAGSFTIPDSVTGIGLYVFSGCTSLTSITIPHSVTSIPHPDDQYIWAIGPYSAFSGCTNLTSIDVDPLNASYSSLDGILFNKDQTTLIQCPEGTAGHYIIPDSVTSIGGAAFARCTSLASVIIPDSVTDLGGGVFYRCTALTNVVLGNHVISLPPFTDGVGYNHGAFQGCFNLVNVIIPDSMTSIGLYAFRYCTSLASVTIGSSVTNIGREAFSSCNSLSRVTIPDSVTSIGDTAFWNCTGLTNVTIGNSVTTINYGAFWGCASLADVYFTGNAPRLGRDVFLDANNATISRLPGTEGWPETYYGMRPIALWLPRLFPGDSRFGMPDDPFGFTLSWASGRIVVVEATSDLTMPEWLPVSTNTIIDGSSYFSDPYWTNHPIRIFRLRSP